MLYPYVNPASSADVEAGVSSRARMDRQAANLTADKVMIMHDKATYNHIADVVVKSGGHGEVDSAVFTVIAGTLDGKRDQFSLTRHAAEALLLMLSNRLKSLKRPAEAVLN